MLAQQQLRSCSAANGRVLLQRCTVRVSAAIHQQSASSASQEHPPPLQQQQQQVEQHKQQRLHRPQMPTMMELLSVHGARLTTAAQMVWEQVSQGCYNSMQPCNPR
jgi:hypothetical protein